MIDVSKFPVAKQAVDNSCWACAARCIMNFFNNYHIKYDSDQSLADAYAAAAKEKSYRDINIQRSLADALAHLGKKSNIDSSPFPTIQEMIEEFKNNRPMFTIIGTSNPKGKPDKKAQDGHWLVIVGANESTMKVDVFDPADGKIHNIDYDAAKCPLYEKTYWQNSSYL